MLSKAVDQCNVIDISQLKRQTEIEEDFDSLIPSATVSDEITDFIREFERTRKEKIGKDSLPEEVFNQVLDRCFQRGDYKGLRDALYLVLQSNWGVRIGDCLGVRRCDFIDQNNRFREKMLVSEDKTDKPRTMYINDTIKMCVLMVVWTGIDDPRSYLLVSASRNKGWQKARDENGKVIRKNGKYVYLQDDNADRIIEPMRYKAAADMLKEKLVDDLGIELKNVVKEVPKSIKEQNELKLDIATHSLRKLYGEKVEQMFQKMYTESGIAHTAAMEFLNWDYNHSSVSITSRYCGDFEKIKKTINMNMKLGYSVVKKYFDIAKAERLSK